MKLKFYFLFLVILMLAVWGMLFVLLGTERGVLFYLAEALLTIGLVFLIFFYRKVVKPLQTIGNGMELLKEQDFSSRLRSVGQVEADRIVQIFNRMMDQLKDERMRLREQNHFLDLLVSASPMGVIILTFDGQISMINKAALSFFHIHSEAEVLNRTLNELEVPLADEIARIPHDSTETVRLSDSMIYRCSHLSFIDRGFAHPFILIESLTAEVMKAEKIAYEKVIRMIAHEVNNTVAGVTSTLDTVDEALEEIVATEELREVMKVCGERCLGMSRFITNFANVVKIPEAQLAPVSLNHRVEVCKIFMENICRNRNINLHLDLCSEDTVVNMDAMLFEQVMVNIIKNAAESIHHQGDIYIKTSTHPATLEIADTGGGISKEVEAKLFSPFFSTKPNGQGIGLIFIREVLANHDCSFSLRSYPDGLTRFIIQFNHLPINQN